MFVINHPLRMHSFPSSWNRGAYYYHYPFFRSGCGRNSVEDRASGKDEKPVVVQHMEHEVLNEDKFYSINIETPGIKAKDIQVTVEKEKLIHVTAEKKDSEEKTTIKYEQKFGVNKRKFELGKVNALYEDGVLSITVPKKPRIEPQTVEVVTEYPPVLENGSTNTDEEDGANSSKKTPFEYTMDLPGVKPSAVTVKFDHDEQEVHIESTRVRGGSTYRKHKVLKMDEEKIEVENLKAYLVDGVLTITAPHRDSNKEDDSTKQPSDGILVIPVIQGSGEVHVEVPVVLPESVADTKDASAVAMNDAEHTKATNATNPDGLFHDAVTVETVSEKEE